MKRSLLMTALAATAALSGAAQAAITIGGLNVDAAFYTSGASAQRSIPPKVAASGALCAGPVYQWNWSSDSKDFKITACQWEAAGTAVVPGGPTIPAALGGKVIAIISRSEGGSLFGVRNVSVPQAIDAVDYTTCPADTPNDGLETGCTGATPKQTDLGVSDEDPKFVCAASQGECSPAQIAGLSAGSFVTNPVYHVGWALQAGQNFPVNDLTAATVSAIFSGAYTRTDQVCAANGTSCASENLRVCVRDNTSGTQAGHRHLWTGISYCGGNTPLGFVDTLAQPSCAGVSAYCVQENSSSSSIPGCLTGADTRSIGIINITNTPDAGTKLLTVDGKAATTANLVTGAWKYYHTSSAQWNTTTQVNTTESTAAQKQAFAPFFLSLLQDPVVLSTAGIGGVAGDPVVSPRSPTNPDTTGVAWHTKFGNNCQAPFLAFPF